MKYIVDLPDAYTSKSALFGDILSIPICLEDGKRYGIPTGIKLEPYTELDEDKSYGVSRYKTIGLAFLKWLGDDVGDKLKTVDDVYKFLDKNCCNKDSVENEVWEFVEKLEYLTVGETEDCFDVEYDGIPFVANMFSYQEAKEKYEAWMKLNNEIHVGDEVEYPPNKAKGIVVQCHVPDVYAEVDKYAVFTGTFVEYLPIEWLTKTGRVFPEVAELLEKMRGKYD